MCNLQPTGIIYPYIISENSRLILMLLHAQIYISMHIAGTSQLASRKHRLLMNVPRHDCAYPFQRVA